MPSPTSRDVRIDSALTDLSIAYRQEMPPASDRIFPVVRVDKQSGKYFTWDKADLWRNNARKRAPADLFARIKLTLSSDTYFAEQFGEEYVLPDETVANAESIVNLERTGTNVIVDNLALTKDISFATDFMKSGVWGTDKTGTTHFVKWNDATSDPSGDVLEARRVLKRATGGTASVRMVGVTGTLVETRLLNHPDAIDRIKYTQAATVDQVRQILAAWLGLDELVVVDREYASSGEGVTDAFSPVVDDDLLVVAVPSAPGIEVPSAGYTFVWDESGRGDMYVETYRDEPIKSDILRGVTYFDHKLVVAALGYMFVDAVD